MSYKCIAFFIIIIFTLTACTKTEKATSEATIDNDSTWEEMDSFHLIMAEVFHPYKDSANLEPVKRLAEELAQEVDKWASAPLPARVNNDDMKAKLDQLKADTKALSTMIQGGASDEDIGATLQALHDRFHRIMEDWNGSPHEHQHEGNQ